MFKTYSMFFTDSSLVVIVFAYLKLKPSNVGVMDSNC